MASPHAPLLEVHDLVTHFRTPRGVVRAVDGVSFTLDAGKTIGIVGESGSGKTVLSRAIVRLSPAGALAQQSGRVLFQGRDLFQTSEKDMREIRGSQVAMVFQDPMTALNPVMKIGRQIGESLRSHFKLSRNDMRQQALELLASVGIPEPTKRIDQYPHELSGGMRQRVMIAIALSCGPCLLIADEPTTALDVTVQAQILDLLQKQQRDRNMGLVLITHDLGVVAGRTDEIAVMYAGKIVEKAPTHVLFSDMKMPYTEALVGSIPRTSNPSHTRLATIPGRPPDLIHPPTGCKFAPRCAYVQDRCLAEEPPLLPAATPGHEYRCWFPVGTPEGRAALEANLARGNEAAASAVVAVKEAVS